MIGDSDVDIQTARNSGMQRGRGHLWLRQVQQSHQSRRPVPRQLDWSLSSDPRPASMNSPTSSCFQPLLFVRLSAC